MRRSLVTFSVLALASGGFCQVPLVSVAGQPFSADEVIIQNFKPSVHSVSPPMKTIRIYRDSAGRTREDVFILRRASSRAVMLRAVQPSSLPRRPFPQ